VDGVADRVQLIQVFVLPGEMNGTVFSLKVGADQQLRPDRPDPALGHHGSGDFPRPVADLGCGGTVQRKQENPFRLRDGGVSVVDLHPARGAGALQQKIGIHLRKMVQPFALSRTRIKPVKRQRSSPAEGVVEHSVRRHIGVQNRETGGFHQFGKTEIRIEPGEDIRRKIPLQQQVERRRAGRVGIAEFQHRSRVGFALFAGEFDKQLLRRPRRRLLPAPVQLFLENGIVRDFFAFRRVLQEIAGLAGRDVVPLRRSLRNGSLARLADFFTVFPRPPQRGMEAHLGGELAQIRVIDRIAACRQPFRRVDGAPVREVAQHTLRLVERGLEIVSPFLRRGGPLGTEEELPVRFLQNLFGVGIKIPVVEPETGVDDFETHGEKETQVRKVLPVHIPAYCPQILQTGFAHSGGQAADDGKLPRIQFVPVRVRLLQPKLVMAEMIGVGEVVVVQAQQVQKIGGFARRNCAAVE